MSNPRPVGGRLVSAAILFFAPLAVLCVLLILKRLVFGIWFRVPHLMAVITLGFMDCL